MRSKFSTRRRESWQVYTYNHGYSWEITDTIAILVLLQLGLVPILASPQTSFGVRLSRIHFKRTPKDVCGEARLVPDVSLVLYG